MREAMGGSVLIQMIAMFVVIYIGIIAIGINYAVSFRVKNQIINLLEDHETYEDASNEISVYLKNTNYYAGETKTTSNQGAQKCLNETENYCIQEIKLTSGKYYYVVTTFVSFEFPFLGKILDAPVKGETMTMG